MITLICADCGEIANYRNADKKYECSSKSCGNNCLSNGTNISNKLNGFLEVTATLATT